MDHKTDLQQTAELMTMIHSFAMPLPSCPRFCNARKFRLDLRQKMSHSHFVSVVLLSLLFWAATTTATTTPLVLRIRQMDGSIQRIQFDEGQTTSSMTLSDLLKQRHLPAASSASSSQHCVLKFGNICVTLNGDSLESVKEGDDDLETLKQKSLEELGIRHGSLLTIATSDEKTKGGGLEQKKKSAKPGPTTGSSSDRWDPYPDIAKDYRTTLRQVERRKRSGGQLSFADLSELHRALHVVEAQPTASLLRLYLCPTVAERFATASKQQQQVSSKDGKTTTKTVSVPRVALLLGTIHRERRNPKKVRAKTSLSSTTESEEYCHAAKVQAVWEPP